MINSLKQPTPKINTAPIFIVGCDRSGTTLLRLMLNQSKTLYIPPETRFIVNLQQNKAVYGNFSQAHQRYFFIRDLQTNQATSTTFTFPVFDLTIAEAETALKQSAPMDFGKAIQAIFRASAAKKNKPRWGDKTPHQVKDISVLAQIFPNAQFVHIIRDGRDVAMSIRKLGWLDGKMLTIARYWQQQVSAGITAGRSLENSKDRYYEIYYEQLLQKPEASLQNLCAWLRLEYTPQMLNYYYDADSYIQPEHQDLFKLNRKPLDPSRVYAWKHNLSKQEIADFESIARDLLATLGYETNGAKISFWVKLVRTTKNILWSWLYQLKGKFV